MNTFTFALPPAHCLDPLPAMLNILFSQALTASCRSRYHCSLPKSPVRVRARTSNIARHSVHYNIYQGDGRKIATIITCHKQLFMGSTNRYNGYLFDQPFYAHVLWREIWPCAL